MLVAYFSATGNARPAIIGSLMRGAVAIVICAVVLSVLMGMNGVWLSFLASEVITLIIFTVFTTVFFKGETLHWNHVAAFVCLILAVYFVFMK